MDAEALRFEDQEFDVAVSLFALLHFPDPLVALKEIHRVLRPNGRLVLAIGSGAPLFSLAGFVFVSILPYFSLYRPLGNVFSMYILTVSASVGCAGLIVIDDIHWE